MSYRILHIVDQWLPDTMNWLDALLQSSSTKCEHLIFCEYRIHEGPDHWEFIMKQRQLDYPITKWQRLIKYFKRQEFADTLKQFAKEGNVDLIHIHFGHMATRYYRELMETGKPLLISLYGFDYEYLVHAHPRILETYLKLASVGASFIVEGQYSKSLLMKYGITATQIHIVHLLFRRNEHINCIRYRGPVRLLQVATYTEKKNQLGLLEALQDRHAGKFVVKFFGENKDKQYTQELMKLQKIRNKHSILIGKKISFEDYLKQMRTSHFTIQWSKRSKNFDTEGGCPVFIKDSLSLACPVISSRHCDIPDIIVHRYNGFLTEEQDLYNLSELLDEILLISPLDYLKLQRNALQSVNQNIEGNLCGSELIGIYKRMVSFNS